METKDKNSDERPTTLRECRDRLSELRDALPTVVMAAKEPALLSDDIDEEIVQMAILAIDEWLYDKTLWE